MDLKHQRIFYFILSSVRGVVWVDVFGGEKDLGLKGRGEILLPVLSREKGIFMESVGFMLRRFV